MEINWMLLAAVLVVASLYSTVGHGGASGYIAVLTLAGFGVYEIRSQVLILNILVSMVGLIQFCRAGHFRFQLAWPFIVSAIPFAYWGGSLHLQTAVLSKILGAVLVFSSVRLFWFPRGTDAAQTPSVPVSFFAGACLGFLAGMTGTGGGIFLTPLLILAGWADSKKAAAVSALFILVNSVSGLWGFYSHQGNMDVPHVDWMVAAYIGGMLGASMGSRFLSVRSVQVTLSVVLAIAAYKLLKI